MTAAGRHHPHRWRERRVVVAAAFGAALAIPACAQGDNEPVEQAPPTASPLPTSRGSEDASDARASDVTTEAGATTNECSEGTGAPYAARYMQALQNGTVKRCTGGCAATECCYQLAACVER